MEVNNITILGGGTAGWMTASTLLKCFPNKKITLIESPNIPTVGVGESTLGQIRGWQAMLGIKDKDFMPACDATYKLSIKFTDFYKKGEAFHYPFGDPYLKGNDSLMNDWWFKKFLYPKTPYSDYATCSYPQMALVNENKCFFNENNKIPFEFYKHTAFQFDATKFGLWLRDNVCIPGGLKHIKEEIKTIEQDEYGIKTLNGKYKADLFIDCAYVYSDKFISDDDALKEFQKHIGTKELDFKKIKFRTGIYNKLWVKNVCAIGLSGGFIEPLESNGLFSVHEFIHQLVRTLQRESVSQWDKDEFTIMCKSAYYTFMEFVAMHYALSHRQDTPYWKNNFNKQWSEEIFNLSQDSYYGFKGFIYDRGVNYRFTNPLAGIHCISAGMHWSPTDIPSLIKGNCDPDMDRWKKKWKSTADRLDKRKEEWKKAVKDVPIMYDFLKDNYYK
jgi:tryptophan halogenase